MQTPSRGRRRRISSRDIVTSIAFIGHYLPQSRSKICDNAINTSRGPLINESALIAAVKAGRIIAALDVYDEEPLPRDHQFRASDHTVLTPHLGYRVAETWRDFYPRSIENAEAFLNGKPIRVLNAL